MTRIIPILALTICACAPTRLRIETPSGHCFGALVRPDVVVSVAHCTETPASVSCGNAVANVETWTLHPDRDLAVAKLSAALSCDVVTFDSPRSQTSGWYLGQSAQVRAWRDGRVTVDIAPRRFCRGSSGGPVADTAGRVVGLVVGSAGEVDDFGCSTEARLVTVDRAWLYGLMGPVESWEGEQTTTGAKAPFERDR